MVCVVEDMLELNCTWLSKLKNGKLEQFIILKILEGYCTYKVSIIIIRRKWMFAIDKILYW